MVKGNNKKLFSPLLLVLIIAVTILIYSLSQPATTTNQINDNNPRIETSYDYKATVKSNLLYPNGGTIEVGDTIIKKITTAIPFNLKSTIHSENEVLAKGTHEVQLLVKAGDVWERMFPLEEKQGFEVKGTALSILDNAYKIDIEKVNAFITQVEEETGISLSQYEIEVIPNIKGTIYLAGKEMNIQVQDKLMFQYSFEEIKLASDKTFSSATSLTTNQVITNNFILFGMHFPLSLVRIISSLVSILVLVTIIFTYKYLMINRDKPVVSQVDKINKKYSSRIISISQKVNMTQKSILTLDSFTSVLKIADDKELPIFLHEDQQNDSAVYFIVDGDYFYSYETTLIDPVPVTSKGKRKGKTYAIG